MDAIITVDEQQRIVLYNRAAEKIFGWTSEEAMGGPLDKLMPERFRGNHGSHMRRFDRTGTTSRRMGDGTVLYGVRSNGEEFPMEASISQLDTAEGKLFTVILRDITERVRAQDELSSFAAEAHAIREGEKSRIARELHDELAQSLTALKMDTIWLRDNAPAQPDKAVAKLAEMVSMLDTTVAATRRIAADLRPLLLDDLGLAPAIEWLAHTFTQRTGVPCEVSVDEELELEEPYATAVFRIVQESLANVGKHAQRHRSGRGHRPHRASAVMLEVRDNGQGFSTAAPRKPHSLGLMGLRERAQLLKGTVAIDSRPGKGTRIQVRIPVQESGASQMIRIVIADDHAIVREGLKRIVSEAGDMRVGGRGGRRHRGHEAGARARVRHPGARPFHARAQRDGADQAGACGKAEASHPGAEHAPGTPVRRARHQVGRERLPHQGKRTGAAGTGDPQDRRRRRVHHA